MFDNLVLVPGYAGLFRYRNEGRIISVVWRIFLNSALFLSLSKGGLGTLQWPLEVTDFTLPVHFGALLQQFTFISGTSRKLILFVYIFVKWQHLLLFGIHLCLRKGAYSNLMVRNVFTRNFFKIFSTKYKKNMHHQYIIFYLNYHSPLHFLCALNLLKR